MCTDIARIVNKEFSPFIVFKPNSKFGYVGQVIITIETNELLENAIKANGQAVSKKQYPDLYQILGDSYSYETLEVESFKNKILKKFRFLNHFIRVEYYKSRTCDLNHFRLPDLSQHFLP